MANMDEFFKAKKTGQSANEASKSDKARPEGDVETKRYRNYYDISNTITTAQATDPNDQDNVNYNQEQVFVSLERNAEKITVSNDGSGTLFVIVSHEGGQNFARERPIYPGENKTYFNIYELRLRSPTLNLPYRVTEYPICCISTAVQIGAATSAQLTPIEKAVLHNAVLPAIGVNWLAVDLTPTNVPTTFGINVSATRAGTLTIAKTRGGVTVVETLNVVPGPALVANGLYAFDMMVHLGDSINFRYSVTDGNMTLRVQEIDAATA